MNHVEHTEPRIYELGYHLVPTLAEEQIPAVSGAVRGMIERISDNIIAEESPVFIDLAYQIVKTINHQNKRFDDAYFGFIKFEAKPEDIAGLEEGLKADENVLRYIVIKTLKENTYLSKKFPSSRIKEREDAVVEEVALATPEAMPAEIEDLTPKGEDAAIAMSAAPLNDELDKAIDELVA